MKNMNENTFENLNAWKESHKFVLMLYKETKLFPAEEKYRLGDQIRRAGASVAANLVEGNARLSKKEYLQFVNHAKGSLEETKYHLLLARDLGYLHEKLYNTLIEQAQIVGKLITGLMRYLQISSANIH